MADYERLVRERKAQTFQKAIKTNVERLVEVGVGAGVNFPYFKQAGVKEVVAVEPNLNFLQKAQAAADRADIQLQVRQGVMEKMPFEDNSVDVVVGTLLLVPSKIYVSPSPRSSASFGLVGDTSSPSMSGLLMANGYALHKIYWTPCSRPLLPVATSAESLCR